jgi:cobalt transporter subunit CbtA
MLQRLLLSGILSGLIVGAFVTMIHLTMVTPISLEAQTYESKSEPAIAAHSHAVGTPAHSHAEEAWAPEDGLERSLYTLAANLVMAVGFGLLLAAAYTISGRAFGWRTGVTWGLAGYLCFSFLPALGLPPELPGSAAADLGARQVWWIATVAASICGLASLVFNPTPWVKAAGIVLLIAPHVIGAPHPVGGETGSVPPELAAHFVIVTMFMNAAMWIALGVATAYFFARFSDTGERGQIVDIRA